jgi:hypothetical protein
MSIDNIINERENNSSKKLNRRQFIKFGLVSLTSLLFNQNSYASNLNNELRDEFESYYNVNEVFKDGMAFTDKSLFNEDSSIFKDQKETLSYFIHDTDDFDGIDKIEINHIFKDKNDSSKYLQIKYVGKVNDGKYKIDDIVIEDNSDLLSDPEMNIRFRKFVDLDLRRELEHNTTGLLDYFNKALKEYSKESQINVPRDYVFSETQTDRMKKILDRGREHIFGDYKNIPKSLDGRDRYNQDRIRRELD